jgi:hypothetical protein
VEVGWNGERCMSGDAVKRAYVSGGFREPDKENADEFGFSECSEGIPILRNIPPISVVGAARVAARRCLGRSRDRPRDALRYLSRASDPNVRCQRPKLLLDRLMRTRVCGWRRWIVSKGTNGQRRDRNRPQGGQWLETSIMAYFRLIRSCRTVRCLRGSNVTPRQPVSSETCRWYCAQQSADRRGHSAPE